MSSDATAVLSQKQPSGKSNRWTRTALIFGSVVLLIGSVLLFFVLWIAGITHGREFDAGAWTFRRFTFIRNPITGNQFTGIQRNSDFPVPPAISVLIAGGPLSPGTRWDLVEIYKGPTQSVGDARVLLDYLSALNQKNNYYWNDWTIEHPKAAPILWSAVRDCVHLPRYDRLPEIFELARSTTEPALLAPKLNQIMLTIADDEAKLQAALGNDAARQRAETLKAAYLNPSSTPAAAKPQAEVEQIP